MQKVLLAITLLTPICFGAASAGPNLAEPDYSDELNRVSELELKFGSTKDDCSLTYTKRGKQTRGHLRLDIEDDAEDKLAFEGTPIGQNAWFTFINSKGFSSVRYHIRELPDSELSLSLQSKQTGVLLGLKYTTTDASSQQIPSRYIKSLQLDTESFVLDNTGPRKIGIGKIDLVGGRGTAVLMIRGEAEIDNKPYGSGLWIIDSAGKIIPFSSTNYLAINQNRQMELAAIIEDVAKRGYVNVWNLAEEGINTPFEEWLWREVPESKRRPTTGADKYLFALADSQVALDNLARGVFAEFIDGEEKETQVSETFEENFIRGKDCELVKSAEAGYVKAKAIAKVIHILNGVRNELQERCSNEIVLQSTKVDSQGHLESTNSATPLEIQATEKNLEEFMRESGEAVDITPQKLYFGKVLKLILKLGEEKCSLGEVMKEIIKATIVEWNRIEKAASEDMEKIAERAAKLGLIKRTKSYTEEPKTKAETETAPKADAAPNPEDA